jgi:hypothetical protein
LVRVLAVGLNDPLRCELVHNVSLAGPGHYRYQAISYTAGDHSATAVITVDGLPFNAFLGVGHMVRRIGRSYQKTRDDGNVEPPPLLWIDQICIDQSDLEERSHQVSSMRGHLPECVWSKFCGKVVTKTTLARACSILADLRKYTSPRVDLRQGKIRATVELDVVGREIMNASLKLEFAEGFNRS